MAFHDLRPTAKEGLELLPLGCGVGLHAKLAHYVDPAPDLLRIDQSDVLPQHPGRFQRLDAPPAGCGGGAYPFRKGGVTLRGVVLKRPQQLAIDFIEVKVVFHELAS